MTLSMPFALSATRRMDSTACSAVRRPSATVAIVPFACSAVVVADAAVVFNRVSI